MDAAFLRQAASRLVAAFAVGAALTLSFAPVAAWPLAVVAPAALFALIKGLPPRRAAWVGAAFGAGLFAFGTYWLYTGLHKFGLVPVWLTLLLQFAFITLMAIFPGSLCYIANRWWLKPSAARDWLVLPALWVLVEWVRSWILTGFPWLSLGYAFIDSPLAGLAPLFGVYGVSWAAALASIALLRIIESILPAPTITAGERRLRSRRAAVALTALIVLFGVPSGMRHHAWTRSAGAPLPVAVIQGAVPQDMKWLEENRVPTQQRYLALTEQAWGAHLIVWPESALPTLAIAIPDYLQNLHELGIKHHADFAIGLVNYDLATERFFNGVLAITAAGDSWYYKRHLVPFGEYFPVPPFIRSWMRLMNLPYADITAGGERQAELRAAGQTLGVTICYEDAFGSEQLAVLRDATLLVNVTNNAWFGDSAAPHQHFQISRMRALEAGRYLIRSTNDGISAVIDAAGRVTARVPQFEQAVLKAEVQPLTGLTPYAHLGNYPVVLGALTALAVAAALRRGGRQSVLLD